MTPATLRLAGEAAFGPRYQTELGRALRVSDRSIRRWIAGTHAIPEQVGSDLLRLLDERGEAQLEARAAIHAERVLSVAREQLAETGAPPDTIELSSGQGLPPALLDRIAAREKAAREKALREAAGEAEKLIRNAYNMGFSEGMRECAYGGVPWSESRPKREGAAAILALIEKEAR